MRELFRGADAQHSGSGTWNPLGTIARAGSRIVVKPNWVVHWNKSGARIDCMVTHAPMIEAVLEYLALANPGFIRGG